MLKLVMANKNYSSWSVRPWFFMTAAKIPFEVVVVGLGDSSTATEIAKWSPSGRLPVLVLEDGSTVWDSLAIGEHLAEAFPDRGVWPRDPKLRRLARSACAEMHAGFGEVRRVLNCNARKRYAPNVWRDQAGGPEAVSAIEQEIGRIHQLWESLLSASSGPFLCGSFGYVDAFFVPVVSRFATYGVASSGAAAAYRSAVEAHPTYQQWQAEALAEPLTIAKYEYPT